jgi:hypothetical protein
LISVAPWGFLPQNLLSLPVQKPLGVFLLAAAAIQRRRGRRSGEGEIAGGQKDVSAMKPIQEPPSCCS